MSDLSIIIVTYNSAKDIGPCLDSIQATKGDLDIEVFVVDNASTDRTVELVRTGYPFARLIANETNVFFVPANNQAIPLAVGRYVLLLNPDTIILLGALQLLVSFMDGNPTCGVCGPRLLSADGVAAADICRPNLFLILFALPGVRILRKWWSRGRAVAVSGACLIIRSSILPVVGLLDEGFFFYDEIDYCLRVKAEGFDVCVEPRAEVVHLEGQSMKSNVKASIIARYTSRIRFFKRHGAPLEKKLLYPLLAMELRFRLLRWWLVSVFHPSATASTTVRTVAELTRRLRKDCNDLQ